MENKTILELREKHLYPTKVPYYSEPLQLVRAKGSYVWDEQGNRYLDVIGGIVCLSVGHNHPRITAKLKQMVEEDAIQHTTFLYLSEQMPTLAAKLAEEAPGDLDCCYITNSGSEANEMAVMTARADTQEPMVVSLQHGYHGGTSTPLSLCGHSNWKFRSQPQAAVTHARAPYCYRCPFGRERGSCDLECVDDVRMTIQTTTSGTIAAMIVEPVLGVGGFIEPPLDYHKEVYKIVKEHGGLYISDEVQTGAGRTGKHFFAIEESGVVPDIISFAKGIGNGAPVGGVITRKDIAQSLKGKLHFNTFGGDPYQSMQAAEVIDIINQEGLISNADVMGNTLRQGFAELKKDYPIIGDIRGRGLLLGLELVKDPVTKEIAPAETARFMELCKEEGVLIGKGSLFGNVIRIAPSLAITEDECEQLLRSCQRAFAQL